jgi:hypothetical protein
MPQCGAPRKECESVALCGYAIPLIDGITDLQKVTRYGHIEVSKVRDYDMGNYSMGWRYDPFPDVHQVPPYLPSVTGTFDSTETCGRDAKTTGGECSEEEVSTYYYGVNNHKEYSTGDEYGVGVGVVSDTTHYQQSASSGAGTCAGTEWYEGTGAAGPFTWNMCRCIPISEIGGSVIGDLTLSGETLTRTASSGIDSLPDWFWTDNATQTITFSEPVNAALAALAFDDADAIHGAACSPFVTYGGGAIDAMGTVGKARYRFGVPAGFSTEEAPRSYYEAQWDDVFFPEAWDAWHILRLAYLARIDERASLTADYEAALVVYAAAMDQYAIDSAAYPGLLAAYDVAMLIYYDAVDAYMVAAYVHDDWYWCELYTPGECGPEPIIPEWPTEPVAPVEPVEPIAPVPPTLPPLLDNPGTEPTPIPSLIGSRSWLWGGDMGALWSEWFVLPLLTAPGEIRQVNLRIKCYKSTRLGVVPTAIGEVYVFPA